MSFNITGLSGPDTGISNIEIIGEFSINGRAEYCPDLSQLKYYKPPVNYDTVYNLKKYHNSAVYKESADVPLDNLLRWVSDHFDDIKSTEPEATGRWLEPEIICFRGTISTLLRTPFISLFKSPSDGFIIRAVKFRGTIYLRAFRTEQRKIHESTFSKYETQSSHWGFKFEQYLLADSPSSTPQPRNILNENEEFCCIFKSQVGTMSLLYASEMDGIRSNERITETVAGKDVDFIELKTFHQKHFPLHLDMRVIKCLNLLKWWSQCYPVGTQTVVVGVKDYGGIVKQIRQYDIEYVAEIGEHLRSRTDARIFLSKFLEHIKETVLEDYDQCIYEFSFSPGETNIQFKRLTPNSEDCTVLPEWYVNKAKQYEI